MKLKVVAKTLSILLILFSLAFLAPLATAIYYKEPTGEEVDLYFVFKAYFVPFLITLSLGVIFWFFSKKSPEYVSERDALAIVSIGWLIIAFLGALPYVTSGTLSENSFHENMIDAYFESMSGFTTTGATILDSTTVTVLDDQNTNVGIEGCEKSILLWRSLTQWLGGMGIIVLSVVILARIMGGGAQLFKAEISGTTLTRLKPEIAKTAAILWKIYAGFTILQIILLYIAGMNLFDSTNHTFCAIATGGFGTKNSSIAYYNSFWIETIMVIFMVIGGTSFILIYHALTGNGKKLFKDQEFRLYVFLILFSTILISANLYRANVNRENLNGDALSSSLPSCFRGAIFQVVSIQTASGFATEDFAQWPMASQFMLLILMFIGGCVASTAGGIKVVRVLVLLKAVKREILKIIHPRAVIPIRLGETKLKEGVVKGIGVFFFLYICIFAISTLAITFLDMNLNIIECASGVATCMGTVGPGLGSLGPASSFAAVAPIGKVWLSMCMIFGRLELFAILTLFFPSTYK